MESDFCNNAFPGGQIGTHGEASILSGVRSSYGPDSAEYPDSQPTKERGIRCNQCRAQLSVVPSDRDRGHEIPADRKQPPHEEAR